jgi:hypothetical protein
VEPKGGCPVHEMICYLFGKIITHVEMAAISEPACITKLSDTEFMVSKAGQKKYGFYPQDPFNNDRVNMERVAFLREDEHGDDLNFWPFIGIAPIKKLAYKDELFYRYGKPH